MAPFWNRTEDLARLQKYLRHGTFGYVTGRRRIGKTALLVQACERFHGLYHQAVEGTPQQQLLHVAEELGQTLSIFREITPKTWNEFFRLLSREKLPPLLVFDEFPYWVQGDSSLPSLLQKWIDHDLPKTKTLFLISGSSQSMLHSQLLQPSAPLYGRASFHLHLPPLSYGWFCRALGYHPETSHSFASFSLVGGVPHYWKLLPKSSPIEQADDLYFKPSAMLAEEPAHWLRDEGVTGSLPKAILDLVGRGVAKPSELAGRLGTAHSNLSRPLALLLDVGLLSKELPFGESARTTKKVVYTCHDPALAFYYGVFLPLRSRWSEMTLKERARALNLHVSRQWESFCRQVHPGSGRYWEGDVEIDLVWRRSEGRHLIAECKWVDLSHAQEQVLLTDLQLRWARTALSRKITRTDFRIFSKKDLSRLAG